MRFVLIFLVAKSAWSMTETPYLIQILSENLKRYHQLREVIEHGENTQHLLGVLNEGIDNATGLLLSMPIKAKNDLARLVEIYSEVPIGWESSLYSLHDATVYQGIGMANASRDYVRQLENNARRVFKQAQVASLRGAQRMTAQTSAQILHALNQLIRINSQILRLQSERMASENKEGKDSARHFDKVNRDMGAVFKQFKAANHFPGF